MTDSHPTNGSVSYTVKELLARQDAKLDTILMNLSGKAERGDLERLTGRVELLEKIDARQQGTTGYARWVWPVLIALAGIGVAIAGVLVK